MVFKNTSYNLTIQEQLFKISHLLNAYQEKRGKKEELDNLFWDDVSPLVQKIVITIAYDIKPFLLPKKVYTHDLVLTYTKFPFAKKGSLEIKKGHAKVYQGQYTLHTERPEILYCQVWRQH
ncbi:MAG: hypothetical protein QW594_02730 [Candidatus Woesearchaeota archaeon]